MKEVIILKYVQITYDLFKDIYIYFAEIATLDADSRPILYELNQKLDKLIAHEYFTKYKKALTKEQRELYRIKYLDLKCVPSDFISEVEVPYCDK